MSKNKILITGAAGFIGSQLAYRFWKMGEELVLIDNFSYGKIDNLKFIDHDFEKDIITMDICDEEGIKQIFKSGKIGYVYNMAGVAPLPDNQLNPQRAIEVNIMGLVNILENARRYGVKKIVQASTNAIYENVKSFPTKENDFTLPTLIYPNTKYCAERFCESYCKTYGMNITCMRFANVYGPHIDCLRKQPPFIGYMIRELYYNRTPTFYSTGEQRRDYIYVDDLIDLAIKVTESAGFDIVNCCSGKNYSVNELYAMTQRIMNKQIEANFSGSDNYWDKYPELYNGQYKISSKILDEEVNKYTLCDNSLAFEKYNWQPKVEMENGLRIVIEQTCNMLRKRDENL